MTIEKTDIRVTTIPMITPIIMSDKTTQRKSQINSKIFGELISQEEFLRKLAYKNTIIKTDVSFFDDSDMRSEYYLIVVHDKISNTPLLSARYYFDKSVIAKYLKGDNQSKNKILNLDNFNDGEIFLADRLSGNINNSIYRRNRNYIFSLFYSEILICNKSCSLLLMVRNEKQLEKYLRLGFHIVGSTMHKEREHWVIMTDLIKA